MRGDYTMFSPDEWLTPAEIASIREYCEGFIDVQGGNIIAKFENDAKKTGEPAGDEVAYMLGFEAGMITSLGLQKKRLVLLQRERAGGG